MRIRGVALVAVVLVTLTAACGGDQRLTKEEYVAAADAICKAANRQLDALPDPTSIQDMATRVEQAVPIEEQTQALEALEPPEADQGTIDQVLALLRQQVDLARQLGAAAQAGDATKVNDLGQQLYALSDKADKIALAYGATECGNN